MLLPKRFIEKEEEPVEPRPPKITKKEARNAQTDINSLLNREDISSNALPSKEEEPMVILIHGYASNKWLWIDPNFGAFNWLRNYREKPKPRSYGWHSKPPPSHMYLPFSYSISPIAQHEGMFNCLMRNGIEVLTYSQIDTFGDIDTAVKELDLLLKGIKKIYGEKKIVLVGHSRGGICARRYLDLEKNHNVTRVILIGTPNKGTNLLNIPWIKQPIIKILNETKLKRFWDISGKREAKDLKNEQMAVNSKFLLDLKDKEKNPEIEYVAIGGSNSTYTHIYSWSLSRKLTTKSVDQYFHRRKEKSEGKQKMHHWVAFPKKILTVFERTLLPEFRLGDGKVSLASAILEEADRKYKIDANHDELACCKTSEKAVMKELKLLQKEA